MIILSGTIHPCVPYIGTFHRIKQVPKSMKSQFYVVEPFAGLSICPNQWKSNFIVEPFAGLSICPNQWKVKTQFIACYNLKLRMGACLILRYVNLQTLMATCFENGLSCKFFFVCSVPPSAMTEGKFRKILQPQLIPYTFSQLFNVVDYE